MFGRRASLVVEWKFGHEYRFNNDFDEPVYLRTICFGDHAQVAEGVFHVDFGGSQ
jgi:hypothetical protein